VKIAVNMQETFHRSRIELWPVWAVLCQAAYPRRAPISWRYIRADRLWCLREGFFNARWSMVCALTLWL